MDLAPLSSMSFGFNPFLFNFLQYISKQDGCVSAFRALPFKATTLMPESLMDGLPLRRFRRTAGSPALRTFYCGRLRRSMNASQITIKGSA